MSRAVRVARPPLAITMSLCAGTAMANRAEKRPLLSTRREQREGAPGGAHGSTQLHIHTHTDPVPCVRTHSSSTTNTENTSLGVHPAFFLPSWPTGHTPPPGEPLCP